MVWPWKKAEIIDMTKMKLPVSSAPDNVEIVDLSSDEISNSSSIENSSSTPNMDFLGGLAGAEVRKENETFPSPGPITDSLREARKSKLKTAFNEMKLKIDDTDYKLNDVVFKMREIERRLRELERR